MSIKGMPQTLKAKREREKKGLVHVEKKFTGELAIRQVGVRSFEEGTHPQMWRVTRHKGAGSKLGPMGGLGEDLILAVTFNPGKIKKSIAPLYEKFTGLIESTFTGDVAEPLQDSVVKEINRIVPIDTGRLKNSMLSMAYQGLGTVENNLSNGGTYMFTMGTPAYKGKEVTYAKVVNRMPTDWLKHPADYHRNVSYRKRIGGNPAPLSDKSATTKFYDLTVEHGRRTAKRLVQVWFKTLARFINEFAKAAGIKRPFDEAKRLFTVAYHQ